MPPLYPGHVPTSRLQKGLVSVFSAFKALNNPTRADMVAALGETTGHHALSRMRRAMRADPTGRCILAERPVIDGAALRRFNLASRPKGSFGAAYGKFLERNGFDPEDRSPVRFVDDEELAYVMLRYRQTHDFAHVLCGLPPTVLGELALKWFEAVQTGLPMCALSALAGPVGLDSRSRSRLRQDLVPWAVKAGFDARPLICVMYEDELDTPLVDLRKRLKLSQAPLSRLA